MYKTKYRVNAKSDLGILSIHTGGARNKGDPFMKPREKILSDDRFRGKQFRVDKYLSASRLFSKFPFTFQNKHDIFQDRISFLKLERKKGFGSCDPAKRDEFSHTATIAKHKETIYKEKKLAALFQRRMHHANSERLVLVDDAKLSDEENKNGTEEEEEFEYDKSVGLEKEKKKREYKKRSFLNLTSEAYGEDCGNKKHLKKYSKHARTKSTAQLYDVGHLHVM